MNWSPDHDDRSAPQRAAAEPITADRWRAIDAIVQRALDYERDRRDAYVAGACHDDPALQHEIVSLLDAHDTAPSDFLERPAYEQLGLTPAGDATPAAPRDAAPPPPIVPGAPTRRMVSAQAAVYLATAVLLLGLGGGWALAHWPLSLPWSRVTAAARSDLVPIVQPVSGLTDGLSLVVVDRTGRTVRIIAADRPWTPRFAADGRRVAYGAFGSGRKTSDVWVTDLEDGATRRLTDDDRDSNDPQWSPDGSALAYSVSAEGGKDIVERPVGDGSPHALGPRPGAQFPSDWRRDGSALLVTEETGGNRHDVLVQPDDGSAARLYAATDADETSARFSPDGRWVAYTSDESGRAEVYVDAYPTPGRRVMISTGGGVDPVWRADGRELYYWRGDELVAVQLRPATDAAPPTFTSERVLFRAAYQRAIDAMYDAAPDGGRFILVVHQ